MTMPALFITGTDTDAGKTYVSVALARLLQSRGVSVKMCKPVATGAQLHEGRWLSEDTRRLAEVSGQEEREVTPWTFALPAAPSLAAGRQGVTLNLEEMAQAVRRLLVPGQTLLVEGIGGLLCPLNAKATIADLVGLLGLPMLVVVANRLGALNHTLLTLEVARWRGLKVIGVVLTSTHPRQGVAEESNAEELRCRMDVPLLANLPYRADKEQPLPELEVLDWSFLRERDRS
jgi:dethiobiotin synthetase